MKVTASNSACAAGFTLLEMLVLLAIVALVSALVVPALRSPSEGVRLRAAVAEITGALRFARASAIKQKQEVVALVDVAQRSLQVPGLRSRRFNSDLDLKVTVAEPERVGAALAGFRFYADGSSTGGTIVVRLGAMVTAVCVDWLSGRLAQGAC